MSHRESLILASLAACLILACASDENTFEPDQDLNRVWVVPATASLTPGTIQQFTAWGATSSGATMAVPVVFTAAGGVITPDGQYTAGSVPGRYQVLAQASDGLVGSSTVTIDSLRSFQPVIRTPQWAVNDDGSFVDVEGPVLHVKFAYGGAGSGGWFKGGGGTDGGMVELYYKPTSTTRNLVFRNGTWGGGRDNLDFFQAETLSVDLADYTTPDFLSGTDAELNSHRVWESAGRLFAEFDFQFAAWHIIRTYILYPWGDVTVHARITLTEPGRWNYLGHTFQFAVSPYDIVNGATFNWGGRYQSDGESFHAWSDGYGSNGAMMGINPYEYAQVLKQGLDRNSAIWDFGRSDQYSGFMIDDENGNDPDIVVMNGDSTTWHSPFDQVAGTVGGRSYVETGIFSPAYTTPIRSFAGTNWFYATLPPCCPPQYGSPMLWPSSLGTWEEVFHVLLRQTMQPSDYIPLWENRARKLSQQAPQMVLGIQQAQLSSQDRLYHVTADAGAETVRFRWAPSASASSTINTYAAFVVEHFDPTWVDIAGPTQASVQAYYSAADHATLVLLTPSAFQSGLYTLTLSRR